VEVRVVLAEEAFDVDFCVVLVVLTVLETVEAVVVKLSDFCITGVNFFVEVLVLSVLETIESFVVVLSDIARSETIIIASDVPLETTGGTGRSVDW